MILVAIVFGTAFAIWLGCHFGGKAIDRMLGLPVIDPSRPIVVPHRLDR